MTLFSIAFALALVSYLAGIGSIKLGAVIILGIMALAATIATHIIRMIWDEMVLERRLKVTINSLMEAILVALLNTIEVSAKKLNKDEFTELLSKLLKESEKDSDKDFSKAAAETTDAGKTQPDPTSTAAKTATEKPSRKPRTSKKAKDESTK